MSLPQNPHRLSLAKEAVEILKRYEHFSSTYQAAFSLDPASEAPRILAKLTRPDAVPFAQSGEASDQKLAHLKDQTAVIRPFYLPQMKRLFDEDSVNSFSHVDFDFAAILGYAQKEDGSFFVKSLFLPSTDAFLTRHSPDEAGVYHIPLGTFNANRLSIDPRKSFARFLYLAERMGEALEYQYDKQGFFHSCRG